jgi:hypothetical protein
MLFNEPKNVPIRPFAPKLPILALDSLPWYPYTDALLKDNPGYDPETTCILFRCYVSTFLWLLATHEM